MFIYCDCVFGLQKMMLILKCHTLSPYFALRFLGILDIVSSRSNFMMDRV